MLKRFRLFWPVYIAILWTGGCTVKEIDKPIIVPQVEKEFLIEMREEPGPAPRRLAFSLRTIKLQECLNTGIRHQLSSIPSRYRLDILGLLQPSDCIPGVDYAKAQSSTEMPAEGLYNFEVLLGNTVSNEGVLHVEGKTISLDLDTDEGIILVNPILLRIPEFTIWGYVGFSEPSLAPLAEGFVNEVGARAGVGNFVPGHYGHFSIPMGTGDIKITGSPSHLLLRPFVFRFTGNFDDLERLVAEYRQQYGAQLDIKISAITGEVF